MSTIFAKKPLKDIVNESDAGLKKNLSAFSVMMFGIGAIIGAGLFIRTAAAAADNAGPAVVIGYLIAGMGCAFAGLCYAEFASRVPVAGSAYTYTYATMGEFIAWIIGWDLVLEYALGAGTVATAWSQYFNKLLGFIEIEGRPLSIPFEWMTSPFEGGIMNLPALISVIMISGLLIRGITATAFVNNIIVVLKLAIIISFIVVGWQFINPANHTPFIPPATVYIDNMGVAHDFGGWYGILGAAGVVFFAYIGFDAVSTVAQETKNPKRDMPIGILGSLLICSIFYVAFSYVLTGVASTEDFRNAGQEASITYAVQTYMIGYSWLAKLITVAILIGLSSVLLVLLMGQSRIFFAMSRDGLLPPIFSEIHPSFRTPYKANILFIVFVGFLAAFIPGDLMGEMTSIGTLFAFTLVSAGVILLRKVAPEIKPGQFKTPYVPLVPILGIIICSAMIYGLGYLNWLRLIIWMLIGFVIYFSYGHSHSKLNASKANNKKMSKVVNNS